MDKETGPELIREELARLHQTVSCLKLEKAELIKALENIKNPLPMLQNGALGEYKLEGRATISLLNSVELYKSIACAALARAKEE